MKIHTNIRLERKNIRYIRFSTRLKYENIKIRIVSTAYLELKIIWYWTPNIYKNYVNVYILIALYRVNTKELT